MAERIKDPDSALPALLEQGVPTGSFEELPTSHQWQQRPRDLVDDSLDDIQLAHCTGNWTQAEKDPALLQALVEKEIEAGHVTALQGGREAAKARWPQRTAIGKLNIVTAEGRDPRLVLDSTISWKKAQLGHSITWCGWTFDFETETVRFARSKLAKLRTMLQTLLHRGKIQRKKLEAALGLLMWATTTCQHVRPYLAPLYRDLHSAVGTLKLIHAHFWQPFLDALDNSATVVAQPPGLWLPIKAKVIFAGKAPIKCKEDLPKVTAAHKGTWIRIADPLRSDVHLSSDSKAAIRWIQQCFARDRLRPLQRPGVLACFAAADAMADDHGMGIGGWIVTATHCAWFAESFTAEQVRCFWPQLSGSPQQYIACFETLAQLALAITARHAMGASAWQFALPAASDNTTAEARTEKLWSTAEPLGTFLKLAAGWAARHHVELLITHLAGEQNTWADELSRGNTSRFRHRAAERYRLPLQSFMDFTGCIALRPPEAAWPDALTAAQLPA